MNSIERCPLCGSLSISFYHQDKRRRYQHCSDCQCVFVPSSCHLDSLAEKTEYDLHQNHIDDAGYRQFLGRLVAPLLQRLPKASFGLDFGCGPGPALARMMEEAGHSCRLYDRFYHADESVFEHDFDFICATEVVEHLRQPHFEIDRLWSRLLPGGVLAIMTKRVTDLEAFTRWHYKNDPTHILFFSEQSFQWLAHALGASLELIDRDVVFLVKPD